MLTVLGSPRQTLLQRPAVSVREELRSGQRRWRSRKSQSEYLWGRAQSSIEISAAQRIGTRKCVNDSAISEHWMNKEEVEEGRMRERCDLGEPKK